MSSKETLLTHLNELAGQLIDDRIEADVQNIIAVCQYAFDEMSAEQKAFLTTAQKGAYNAVDRNRVADFCNTLVELMEEYYGTETEGFTPMMTTWENVTDPTEAQLTAYIAGILIVRDKWYTELNIPGMPPTINQIYDGITLSTANNIERVLRTIHNSLIGYMFSTDARYSGQLYGPSSTDVIACGLNIWMGVDQAT